MKNYEFKLNLDYKDLYFDLKEKYDKLKTEIEELKLEEKIKDNELNKLRIKLNAKETLKINLNSFDKKDLSYIKFEDNNNIDSNIISKHNSKKYETYSVDSFRNEMEQRNDLLNDLMKSENEEIKLQNLNYIRGLMEIEKRDNFQISTKKLNVETLILDIDSILLNIKKKQESLYQTKTILNLKDINSIK